METLSQRPAGAAEKPRTAEATRWATELVDLGEALRPRLLFLAQRLGVPERDAEDMVQETLLLAFVKAEKITRPTAWLLATLRYRCWMYWRRQGHRASSEVAPDVAPAIARALATTPDQEAWAVLADVRRELALLPARARGALIRKAVLGEPAEEVARRYGYQPASIRKTVARSREKLAARLAAEPEALPG